MNFSAETNIESSIMYWIFIASQLKQPRQGSVDLRMEHLNYSQLTNQDLSLFRGSLRTNLNVQPSIARASRHQGNNVRYH
jgi:hypothetical protein